LIEGSIGFMFSIFDEGLMMFDVVAKTDVTFLVMDKAMILEVGAENENFKKHIADLTNALKEDVTPIFNDFM
jgi:hypothetical protein